MEEHLNNITFYRRFHDEVKQFTETRQGAIYKAVMDYIFERKPLNFTMYDHRRKMTETYKRIIRAIEAEQEELRALEEKIDDLDYLLSPGAIREETRNAFIREFIHGNHYFPTADASDAINSMLYEDFLQTPYWKSISHYVRQRDGNQCSICGSTHWLQAHHTSYLHHGDELHHLDDLTTLCKQCHDKVHDEDRQNTTINLTDTSDSLAEIEQIEVIDSCKL